LKSGLIICTVGLFLIIAEIIFRRWLKKENPLIPASEENRVLVFFFIGNAGLWLFLLSATVLAFKSLSFSSKWFIIFGIITGFISAFRNFVFWGLSDDKYEKKPALGEPIGGMGLGCLAFVVLPLLGAITGYIIKRFLS
jgi:hypothetical protein